MIVFITKITSTIIIIIIITMMITNMKQDPWWSNEPLIEKGLRDPANNSTYTEGPLVVAGSNFDRFLGNGFSDCIGPVQGGEVLGARGGDLDGREGLDRDAALLHLGAGDADGGDGRRA